MYAIPVWTLCVLFIALLAGALELGFRSGLKRRQTAGGTPLGVGAMEAAVFGLFGLLLALTFSFVMSRAEARRNLVIQESNAIGTAYLRSDIAPDPLREQLRDGIRRYLDARIADVKAGTDEARAAEAWRRAIGLQRKIWSRAAGLVRERPDANAFVSLLEALNDLIERQTARDAAMRAHLDPFILLFLTITALGAAVVAGYSLGLNGERHGVAGACFVVLTVLVAYVLLDIDRPRRGFFQPPIMPLVELRDAMRSDAP